MRNGKQKCETLKALRKEIAAKNGIPFEPHVCTHEGECRGTCPACESEVRYLERMLGRIEATGRKPQLVGISACLAAMVPVALGCTGNTQKTSSQAAEPVPVSQEVQAADSLSMEPYDPQQEAEILVGDSVPVEIQALPKIPDEYMELAGDVEDDIVMMGEVEEDKDLVIVDYDEPYNYEPVPLQLVEEKPKFDGGDLDELAKWVSQNLDPEIWSKYEGSRRVMTQFIIEKDGSVSNIKVLRGIDPETDNDAVRVISSLPRFTPGLNKGEPVRVLVSFPVQTSYQN